MIRRSFAEWLNFMIDRRSRLFGEVVRLRRLADEYHIPAYREAAEILSTKAFMIMHSIRIARKVHDDRARMRICETNENLFSHAGSDNNNIG